MVLDCGTYTGLDEAAAPPQYGVRLQQQPPQANTIRKLLSTHVDNADADSDLVCKAMADGSDL